MNVRPQRRMPPWWAVLCLSMALSTFGGPPAGAGEATPLWSDEALQARVVEVAEELRCLVCQNETVAASQADLAVELREQIRQRLSKGESPGQIIDFMVDRYGEFVRYKPRLSSTTLLLWFGPFALLLLAGYVLVANIRIHQRSAASPKAGLDADEPGDPLAAGQGQADLDGLTQRPSRPTALALFIGIPVVSACLYGLLGQPAALLDPTSAAQASASRAAASPSAADMTAMLDGFARHMDAQPPNRFDDLEGWVMLARTYASLQRFADAAHAFGKASALAPRDAQIVADWADVVAMQPGADHSAEAAQLTEQALRLDPSNLKALALAGTMAFQAGHYDVAVMQWARARALASPSSPLTDELDKSLAQARQAIDGQRLAP